MYDGRIRGVLVLGGSSEIALATISHTNIELNGHVILAGRDRERLTAAIGKVPGGPDTRVDVFDAADPGSIVAVIERAFTDSWIDLVLVTFGVLGDEASYESEPLSAAPDLAVNVTGNAVALLESARRLREQGWGTLVVFSSIAAVRPRKANAVYGAGKVAIDALARGIADSLHGSGVRLVLARPGFVVGRMTAGRKRAPFATTPEAVAQAVVKALGTRAEVVWVPSYLRWVAAASRLVPRALWRRLPY